MELQGKAFRYCKVGTYDGSTLTCTTCNDDYYFKKKTTD